ncbi:hypothetical protein EVAR_72754_1 [Eumeta japonica]|uniref:Uncharacterized protein n=1 Tax=Eumeta variegata TaxID=151549 RepID=A0A4C1STN3_EUMVA|nr:hypothetical protein EVAR_72754_1 [Eumeta japonica]
MRMRICQLPVSLIHTNIPKNRVKLILMKKLIFGRKLKPNDKPQKTMSLSSNLPHSGLLRNVKTLSRKRPLSQYYQKHFMLDCLMSHPSENMNIWAALEAHRGEEPIIVDPKQEEEKMLAQQYDIMTATQDVIEEQEFSDETQQEPNKASLWYSPSKKKGYGIGN